jgi:hypothetical protein
MDSRLCDPVAGNIVILGEGASRASRASRYPPSEDQINTSPYG